MRLTIWLEDEFCISGYKFFARCEKLYINDMMARLEGNSKIILDAWEITLEHIKNEKNEKGTWSYEAETIDIYTLPYLIIQHFQEAYDERALRIKVIKE
jgi:hypothetical protein